MFFNAANYNITWTNEMWDKKELNLNIHAKFLMQSIL